MFLKDRDVLFLATGGGCGYSPYAPGTVGSFAALPLGWGLSHLSWGVSLVLVAVFAAAAVHIAHRAGALLNQADPGAVVIDEIAGVMVACLGLKLSFSGCLITIVIFRFYDVLKPFPVGWLDRRLKGGRGIVADDLAAGLLTNLTFRAGVWLLA
ncbi:MAG: phosphatidylglycerophosphatase A [Desulfobacterales bacterium]|nr:phosphatidylglycerophosphatase A [Desulfobacterales bacterium]